MKPKVDFAFKEIMEDVNARTGFLAAILKLDPSEITETRILNTNLRKLYQDDKLGILDVRVLLNNDSEIDVEIHLTELKVWADRSLFYLAKMFTAQIGPGETYNVFKKCISISILGFTLFRDEPDFYSCFHIREDTRHFLYTDRMEFHVIELPKLPGELREDSDRILLWAKFINAERKEEFEMLAKRDPYIESAYQHLQIISQDGEKRREYEARQRAILDYNQGMLEAREAGRTEGRAEGRAEGKAETERNMIHRLLTAMPPEQIAEVLKIPVDDVRKIAGEN